MVDLFKNMSIEAKLVDSFDKEELEYSFMQCLQPPTNEFTSTLLRKTWYTRVTAGEISLFVKSFWVYYQLLLNNQHNAMVLEDDVEFGKNVTEQTVTEALSYIPPNYSVFQLGCCLFNRDEIDKSTEGLTGRRGIQVSLGKNTYCTAAYVISRQGAILLFKSLPISHPIDWQMVSALRAPDYSVYGLTSPLFLPNIEVNDISHTGIRG